jgi:hypothetical protein
MTFGLNIKTPCRHPAEAAIQRIIEVPGGSETYRSFMEKGKLPAPEGADLCPFCRRTHPLRRHGTYSRTVVTENETFKIDVRRFLCVSTGRTVSLLPDFLVPRKQHSCGVIISFFYAWAIAGLSISLAAGRATSAYPSRQKAQAWIRGFWRNLLDIEAYLDVAVCRKGRKSSKRRRMLRPSKEYLAFVLLRMIDESKPIHHSFEFHSRCFHERFGHAIT